MPDKGFPIALAIQVLQQRGLLAGVIQSSTGQYFESKYCQGPAVSFEGCFQGAVLDNRELKDTELFVALAGEKLDGRRFASGALEAGHWVLTRPLTGKDDLLMARGQGGALLAHDPEQALAALGAHWRSRFAIPVVGVTGTNGKTTTKDFLASILRGKGPVCATEGNFNNKLGLPLTLLQINRSHQSAVIEMGASSVGHIAHLAGLADPTVAVITNASEAHLEEFGSLENIIQGKGEILDKLPDDGVAVLNADSPGFENWQDRAPCSVSSFGEKAGKTRWTYSLSSDKGTPQITIDGESWTVPLPGLHNGANLVAAILAARAVGLSDQEIRSGLESFTASAHRSLLFDLGGRHFLDDAYNANPTSMIAAAGALLGLKGTGRAIAVLGHMAELGENSGVLHLKTGHQMEAAGVDAVLAVGKEAAALAEGFHGSRAADFCFESHADVADWLTTHSRPGDRILVKGSRSAAMEKLIDILKSRWATEE